jgi:leucyl-tRNA synthetase
MKQKQDYEFINIEKKWQQEWNLQESFLFDKNSQKPKYYVLEMLPYPSGNLHMGHIRNYTIGDVMARFKKMQDFNVIHPMGWDAFGLPAENAAIEGGIHPEIWTKENISRMKKQLQKIGFSYDWSMEIATCDPDYYKHEQQMFIDFYNKGLIYQKETEVNWDPVDNTVLANEQVVDGRGWRSGAVIEKRKLKQWFLKISDYAEELLEDLNDLHDWPEKVRLMQQNWIGKSTGAEIYFTELKYGEKITVFTTRPDTIFGASFVAISPDHPLTQKLALTDEKIANFIVECKKGGTSEEELETKEKIGINTGLFATLKTEQEIKVPVFIANFVLMEYGTGAIFGCPAHDERDHEFAIKYNLPIKDVIAEY